MQCTRQAAENDYADSSARLARAMYIGLPYAREVGHVGDGEASGVATSAGGGGGGGGGGGDGGGGGGEMMEGHDVPPDVLTSVVHWFLKGGFDPAEACDFARNELLEGAKYCHNEGCEVGRCRLILSKPVLIAPLVSVLKATM